MSFGRLGAVGRSFGRLGAGSSRNTTPRIQFSGSLVEGSAEDTAVATATLYDPRGLYGTGGTPWSITAQSNANWFKINTATGAIAAGSSASVFATNPAPTVTLRYSDGVLTPLTGTFVVTVTAVVDTTAPTITSSNSVSVQENATLSHSLTANETITWSIVGGADQAKFEISGSTLRFASNGTKDFEAPDDADTNNAYIVQVRATDTATNTTDQTITVSVTDVGEGGGTAGEAMGLLLTLTKAA